MKPLDQARLDQARLDAIVSQRLEWVARFASSVAHDLGNIVLFSSAPRDSGAEASDELQRWRKLHANLTSHLKQVLSTMILWRDPAAAEPRGVAVKAWWGSHGSLLRQFTPPEARLSLASTSADAVVDAADLIRIVPAALIAIDAQVRPLKQVILGVSEGKEAGELELVFAVSPGVPPRPLLMPSMVNERLVGAADGCRVESANGGDSIVLRLRSALNLAPSP